MIILGLTIVCIVVAGGSMTFVALRLVPWIGVDADKVVPLVVGWSLLSQDVPSHQVAHDEELRTGGNHRKPQEFTLRHDLPLS